MLNAFFILLMKLLPAIMLVVVFVTIAVQSGAVESIQEIVNAEYLAIPQQ